MKKKVSKAAKRRLTMFGTLSLLAVLYFSVNIIDYTLKITNLKESEQALSDKLDKLKYDEKELSTEILKLNDPEYIARYARENYQYSKDGEYIIQINEDEDDNEEVVENKDFTIPFFAIISALSIIILVKKISHI